MLKLLRHSYIRIGLLSIVLCALTLFVFSLTIESALAIDGGGGTVSAPAGVAKAKIDTANTESGFISTRIGQFIGNMILTVGSMVTWAGGSLLEISINKFILNLGTLLSGTIGVAIENTWRLIRDISNLAFIFGFIYIGIRTIIDSGDSNTKRMLASIIIGALLINFSLFFTKIIIDISNYISVEIYNSLISSSGSISAKFADMLGITTLFAFPAANQYTTMTAVGNVAFYFMGALMLIVAGFVFAAGAILILIRFVALVFIMIFSPLLFAATVFPQTQSMASDLWKKLIDYSFFAPAYLILLVVSIKVLEGFTTGFKGTSTLASALTGGGQADSFNVIANFVVAILFLIMSLQVAQKFGIKGSEKVMSVGNSLRGKAQSWTGRNSLGWASKKLLKGYDALDSKAANTKGGKGFALKTLRTSLATVAGGERSLRGTLETGKKAKFGGSYSHADDVAYDDEQKKRRASAEKMSQFMRDVKSVDDALLAKTADLTPPEEKLKIKLERAIADASTTQLEELKQDQRKKLVEFMTQSQIDALGKSDKLSEIEKDEINAARSAIFKKKFGFDGTESKRNEITKANSDQLNAFGAEHLSQDRYAVRLTGSQMDDLKKKLTPTEYTRIDDARKKALIRLAEGGAPIDGKTAQNHILTMKSSDASKLPKEVLIALGKQLSVSTLTEIRKQNTLTVDDQRAILEKINDAADVPIPDGVDPGTFLAELAERETAVTRWLQDSPYGKEFGK